MEFRIDGDFLNSVKIHRQDAMKLVKYWRLDRFMNPMGGHGNDIYLDANETVFFGRELEYIKKRAYNKLYPAYLNTFFCPVDSEADTGSDSVTYESYDSYGEAAIVNDEATDYQQAEVVKDQTSTPVKTLGSFCKWNLQELRRSAMAVRSGLSSGGKSISQRKIDAALKAIAQKQEKIVAGGDEKHKLVGFFNNSNIQSVVTTADGTGGSSAWSTKDNEKIARDFFKIINQVRTGSNGIHVPNTVIMDLENHLILATNRIANTNVTLLSFLKKAYAESGLDLNIYAYPRINEGVADGNTRVIAYERNAENLQQEIPQQTEVFPPQQQGTAFKTFVRKRHGGVQIRYANAFASSTFTKSA